ncbi:MAG: hypothetical protein V3575_01100 [Candidatus Absconditabacteria bacterium]
MKKIVGLLMSLLIIAPMGSFAYEIKTGEDFTVNIPISDDYYVAGGDITLDSDVQGDLIIAGGEIKVKGNVTTDINVAGGTVDISGNVGDDIRVAGGEITIDGNVGGDLIAFGGKITISRNSVISGDILMAGGVLNFEGIVNGKAKIRADKIVLNGEIGKDAQLFSNSIQVGSNAKILGKLEYKSPKKNNDLQGIVSGEIKFTEEYHEDAKDKIMGFVTGFLLIKILFLTIFGSLLVLFAKKFFNGTNTELTTNPWKSLLRGFLLYVSIPFAIIISFITVVGRPIGIILILGYIALFILGEIIGVTVFSSLVISNLQKKGQVQLWKKLLIVLGFAVLFGLINGIDIIAIFFAVGAIMAVKFNVVKQGLNNIENKE